MLRSMMTSLVRLPRIGASIGNLAQTHQELLLLLAIFVSTRLSLLLISRPQGYFYDASDYDFYLEFGRLSDLGLYPMLHYWTEYPPLFPWISVAAYKAIAALPNLNGSPILWFRLALGPLLLVFDAGNLILIYYLGRAIYPIPQGSRPAWAYALLFTPLHVWLGWFDTLPLFLLLLSVFLVAKGRYSSAAVASGLGFMVKVFPILALPALLKAERHGPSRIKLLAEAALAAALAAAPFLVTAPEYLLASFRSMISRSPWETPWAIAEGYFGYGEVAPLQDRLDPSSASFVAYQSHLPWPAITALFGAVYILIWTRRFDARRTSTVVAFAGLTVNLFLLYSKGYSPQFLVYVVPFALLVLPTMRAVGYLATLAVINLLEYPIYLTMFHEEHWVLGNLVMSRTVLLLLMTWDYLAVLGIIPAMERLRMVATTTALIALAVGGIAAAPAAGQAWVRASMDYHPNARLIDYLLANTDSESVVLFSEQWLYRDLYPYLHQQTNLVLVEPTVERRVASSVGTGSSAPPETTDVSDRLGQLSRQYREIFGVRHVEDRDGKQLEQLLAEQNHLAAARRVRDLAVTRWSTRP